MTDPNLIHLSDTQWNVRCGALCRSITRQTKYPALVDCSRCIALFTDEQRNATDPNQDEPSTVE